jgi:riboflavin biosynthesis pyrimidine reductase
MAIRLPFAVLETPLYRRWWPSGTSLSARSYLQSLQLRRRHSDRPYVLANMVASVDGHATVDANSRALSGASDRSMFYALRERVDAVLVGTRTLAAERYKRMLPAEEPRQWRMSTGRPAEPLAVTISRSGNVPRDIPLFADAPDRVMVLEGPGIELSDALCSLRQQHGIESLLCEGGPTLFGALLKAGLVDELFLTLAPKLVGGGASGPAVVSGPPPEVPAALQLVGVLEHDGALFLRYKT